MGRAVAAQPEQILQAVLMTLELLLKSSSFPPQGRFLRLHGFVGTAVQLIGMDQSSVSAAANLLKMLETL